MSFENKQDTERRNDEAHGLAFNASFVPVCLLIWGTGTVAKVNRAFCELTGYTEEQIIGRRHFGFRIFDQRKEYRRAMAQLVRDGVVQEFDFDLRSADGSRRACMGMAELVEYNCRKHILVVCVDATQRRQSEIALRESEMRYRAVVENSLQGIVVVKDWPPRVIYANPAVERVLGYSEEEVRAMSPEEFAQVIATEDRGAFLARYRERLAGNGDESLAEYRIRRADGQYRTLEVVSGPIVWEGESAVLATFLDTTERAEAERIIRESEERLELALTGAELGWWDMDARTGTVQTNDTLLKMLGYRSGEVGIHQDDFHAIVHPEDRPRQEEAWKLHRQGKRPFYEAEIRMRTRDNQWKWVLDRGKIVRRMPDGRPLRVAGTHSDIDMRRRAEEAMRHARDEAELASRAKSQFLAMMSHEIRTPMNAIVGFADLISVADDEQERQLYAENIQESARHLLNLLNNILDYSQITSDRAALENAPFGLQELIQQIEEMFVREFERKGLDLRVQIEEGLPDSFLGDRSRLQQVICNLLQNAQRFTMEGHACLTIRGATDEESEHWELYFEVSDTGPGITPERLSAIFNPFEQEDSGANRRHEGTGMGLAICREVIKRLGGELRCESKVGEGSRFFFKLPMTAVPEGIKQD